MAAWIALSAVLFTFASSSPLLVDESSNSTSLEERQAYAPCGTWTGGIERVGNGDPHQVWYDQQLSETLWCDPNGENDCQESTGKSWSISIEADLGATIVEDWIDGGFSVSYSWETSDSQTCGSHSGQNSCVWYSTAMTAYTVRRYRVNSCTGKQYIGKPFVMRSPNKNNVGGKGFYCVVGTCRTKGQGYYHGSVPGGTPV